MSSYTQLTERQRYQIETEMNVTALGNFSSY